MRNLLQTEGVPQSFNMHPYYCVKISCFNIDWKQTVLNICTLNCVFSRLIIFREYLRCFEISDHYSWTYSMIMLHQLGTCIDSELHNIFPSLKLSLWSMLLEMERAIISPNSLGFKSIIPRPGFQRSLGGHYPRSIQSSPTSSSPQRQVNYSTS